MKSLISFCAVAMAVLTAAAHAENRDKLVADCATIEACLSALDPAIPKHEIGIYSAEIDAVRVILKNQFGEDARNALIEKARTGHDGWNNFATALLAEWGGWEEKHIPVLRELLQRDHGGWIARALGDIGSPAAIEVLIEDLPYAGIHSQTGWALAKLGTDVLPYVLSMLEPTSANNETEPRRVRDRTVFAAQWLIGQMRSSALAVADEWIAISRNRRERKSRRIAALTGLAAMNGYLGERAFELRPLLRNRDEAISGAAYGTLVAAHDPFVARKLAKTCAPSNKQGGDAGDPFHCLFVLSDFGGNASAAGEDVIPFLSSEHALEQAYGIETLGLIGYREAIPQIEPFLTSSDWRLVYAAVRALGRLQAYESVPAIEKATLDHWLPGLRRFSEIAVLKIIRHQPYDGAGNNYSPRKDFGDYNEVFRDETCNWNAWAYNGRKITFERSSYQPEKEVHLADGKLVAIDKGEFGGSFEWRPDRGEPVTLVPDNTSKIFRVKDGFLSIHGLSHLTFSHGYATLASRKASGEWTIQEVVRFPGAAYDAKRIHDETFAVKSAGYAVIFSTDRIIDVAECDYSARPRQE